MTSQLYQHKKYSKHEQPQPVNSNDTAININKLLSGMGVRKHQSSIAAIPIQDLVRELNRGARGLTEGAGAARSITGNGMKVI